MTEEAVAREALRQMFEAVAPRHLPVFFWIGLPQTSDSIFGGSADMDAVTAEVMAKQMGEFLTRLKK